MLSKHVCTASFKHFSNIVCHLDCLVCCSGAGPDLCVVAVQVYVILCHLDCPVYCSGASVYHRVPLRLSYVLQWCECLSLCAT